MTDDERAAAEAAAWDANVAEVQRAKAELAGARASRAIFATKAARAERDTSRRAVLTGRPPTADELAHLEQLDVARQRARATVAAAIDRLDVARQRFKAGVTPEQIEEASR